MIMMKPFLEDDDDDDDDNFLEDADDDDELVVGLQGIVLRNLSFEKKTISAIKREMRICKSAHFSLQLPPAFFGLVHTYFSFSLLVSAFLCCTHLQQPVCVLQMLILSGGVQQLILCVQVHISSFFGVVQQLPMLPATTCLCGNAMLLPTIYPPMLLPVLAHIRLV